MNGSKITVVASAAVAVAAVLGLLYEIYSGVTTIQTKVNTIDTQLQVAMNNIEHLQNSASEIKVVAEKSDEGLKKEIAALGEKIDKVHPMGWIGAGDWSTFLEIGKYSDALSVAVSGIVQASAPTTFECSGTPIRCHIVTPGPTVGTPESAEGKPPKGQE